MFPQDTCFYSSQKLWSKEGKAEFDYVKESFTCTGVEGMSAAGLRGSWKEDKPCYWQGWGVSADCLDLPAPNKDTETIIIYEGVITITQAISQIGHIT